MAILKGQRVLAALIVAAPLLAQSVPVKEHILSNGMRVIMVERHDKPTVAAGWMVKAGSVHERPGITGLAHLFEHMMFKGTKAVGTKNPQRDAEINDLQDKVQVQIRQEISLLREKQRRGEIADMNDPSVRSERHQQLLKEFDALVKEQRGLMVKDEIMDIYTKFGATGINANTAYDRTFYHITVPSTKLELWAWMESDRLANGVFREFYSERDVVLEERRQRVDATPMAKEREAFFAMNWLAHPYGWPVLGWPSDISSVTREQAQEFFSTYYAPNNISAVIVGDFKAEEAIPMMERYFGRIPKNPKGVPELITLEPKSVAEQRMVAEAEAQPMTWMGYTTVSAVHKDTAALDVLANILNGNSGRLQKELVLNKKVATAAQSFHMSLRYNSTFFLIALPAGDGKPEDMEPLLIQEMEKIQKEGISDRELQKVKNQMLAMSYKRLESNEDLVSQLAEAESIGTYKDFQEEPARLQAVTKDDVQRVAKAYFNKENRKVMTVNRPKSAGPVDPELAEIPEAMRGQAKAAAAQFAGETDLTKLKGALGQIEAQSAQVPPQVKPFMEYLKKKLNERIQKLEGK